MTPESREAIRRELAGYILSTAAEWMRLIDMHVDPDTGAVTPEEDHQYRTSWEFSTDDAAVIVVKELDRTEVARFGVQITVDALPDLPPIGPENDPALAYEPPWHDSNCQDVCCQEEPPRPEWHPATFAECLAGDRIRLGGQETVVTASDGGMQWQTNGDNWRPAAAPHTELRLDLEANPGMKVYPMEIEIEILCDRERLAVLNLQKVFVGSTIVSS